MNNRALYFLSPLILIVFLCASTCVAYSQQQTVENSPGSISGHLTTAQKPLPNIEVQLTIPALLSKDQLVRTAVTDETGYYQFIGLAPAAYGVCPNTKKFVPSVVNNYGFAKPVNVKSGEHVANIDFDLSPGAKIQGQIRDATGNPVVGQKAFLTVVSDNQKQVSSAVVSFISTASDDEGKYTVENIWPGKYFVFTGRSADYVLMMSPRQAKRSPIYGQTFYPGAAKLAEATAIELTLGANITGIDITVGEPIKTYQIIGRVIDEQTGAPIPNLPMGIVFTGADGVPSDITSSDWTTDANGQFRMPVVLPGHIIIKPSPNAPPNGFGDPIELDITDKDITGLEIKMHRVSTQFFGISRRTGILTYPLLKGLVAAGQIRASFVCSSSEPTTNRK